MLSKFFLRAAVTAAALTCSTGSASAENYDIMIAEFSFFPSVSYVQPGDTITFINDSGIDRELRSKNADWFIPDLADGASASIVVEEGWKNDFFSRIKGADNGGQDETGETVNVDDASIEMTNEELDAEPGTIRGALSYGQPPSEAVAPDSGS